MMFASNPLQLCNLIPIVHRDNLRGDRNQWAYDLDNRVKASDHIGICNVMGDPAGHEVKGQHFDSSQKQQSDGRNPQQTIVRSSLRSECRYALAALGYFTRLPMPRWVGPQHHDLGAAARYFPLAGIIVGATAALV